MLVGRGRTGTPFRTRALVAASVNGRVRVEMRQLDPHGGRYSPCFVPAGAAIAVANVIPIDDDRRRRLVVRRLVDLLFQPSGHMTRHERALVDETVANLFPRLPDQERERLSRRVAELADPPRRIAALMARERIETARLFLDRSELFGEDELGDIIAATSSAHHLAIAERSSLPPRVIDALIATGASDVVAALLQNHQLEPSRRNFFQLVDASRRDPVCQALLLSRPDLPADVAHLMFWWVAPEWRAYVLQRYAMDRRRMAEVLSDVPEVPAFDAADIATALRTLGTLRIGGLRDHPSALDLLPRWLADPGAAVIKAGMMEALSVQPETLARIAGDDGGEPLIVLAKAMGMTASEFAALEPLMWESLSLEDAERRASLRTLFETLSTDWADLVLRLWDRQANGLAPPFMTEPAIDDH